MKPRSGPSGNSCGSLGLINLGPLAPRSWVLWPTVGVPISGNRMTYFWEFPLTRFLSWHLPPKPSKLYITINE